MNNERESFWFIPVMGNSGNVKDILAAIHHVHILQLIKRDGVQELQHETR